MGIRIRALRLIGLLKNYDVSFVVEGYTRSLSIVAGEISTGKTSVLEMIDYCLGARQHPRHQEIYRKARASMLEIEANSQIFVIERPLFTNERFAWVHNCSLADLDRPHVNQRRLLDPAGSAESLSTFLLDQCGLGGLFLKEAPTQEESGADPLSFRDIMWLCYLENVRLDDQRLMYEGNFMQSLKLRQVIAVVFGVHDDQAARLGDQIKNLEARRRELDSEIRSLRRFLDDHGIWESGDLEQRLAIATSEEQDRQARISELDIQMRSETNFADEMRQQYDERVRASRMAATVVRDRETLLRRLLPLRGQYAEDERKLVFYAEARQLFDPLRVSTCPACLQDLPSQITIDDATCSLCGQPIEASSETIDVQAEINAVRARHRALERYVSEVESSLALAMREYQEASSVESELRNLLDTRLQSSVAPYIAERDIIVRQQEILRAEIATLNQQSLWREGLNDRVIERERLERQIASVRELVRELSENQPDRGSVVEDLTTRFRSILEDFGFPKLSDPEPPYLDAGFTPYVRGDVYRGIGSAGAKTLISLAWMLAIFERAMELGHPHPGFLMIDSPQKNLKPLGGEADDEFRSPTIVAKVWNHLLRWSSRPENAAQIIVVDNAPPPGTDDAVVIRYTGRPDGPPYGLIDDETA